VLTDEEVETIRRKLRESWRGPVLLTWVHQLLDDRDQLVARLRVLEATRDDQRPSEPSPVGGTARPHPGPRLI
jgi:hypothetical protein